MKRSSTSRALCVLGCLGLLAGCGAGADASAPPSHAQALRVADADPAEVAHMKAVVAPLVSRDPSNVRVMTDPTGAVHRQIKSGFGNVILLHRGADGKNTVTCVDSVDGVDAALTSARPAEVR